jgi:hypothetical protein
MARRAKRKLQSRRLRPFRPSAPVINYGKFKGRPVNELSDDDLVAFIKADARGQTRQAFKLPEFFELFSKEPKEIDPPITVFDHAHYWCARFELERRKPDAQRTAGASLEIDRIDTDQAIAVKLLDYGYKTAARKYHPDRGGSTAIMQQLNRARELARKRLKD